MLIMTSARRTDMHRECTGINKTNYSLHTAMKSSILMEYFMEDFQTVIDEFAPDVCTDEHWSKMGLSSDADKGPAMDFVRQFRSKIAEKRTILEDTFEFERQQLHVCQNEGADFLKLYAGNSSYSEKTVKRVTFWKKSQNRKENEDKQTANKAKSKQNGNNANFRKNNGGKNGNGNGNAGNQNGGQNNPNYKGNNNNNNNSQNYNSSNSNGYNKPKWDNTGKGSFTEAKCPHCLEKPHGSLPCKK
jgi:hypothetical protein